MTILSRQIHKIAIFRTPACRHDDVMCWNLFFYKKAHLKNYMNREEKQKTETYKKTKSILLLKQDEHYHECECEQ